MSNEVVAIPASINDVPTVYNEKGENTYMPTAVFCEGFDYTTDDVFNNMEEAKGISEAIFAADNKEVLIEGVVGILSERVQINDRNKKGAKVWLTQSLLLTEKGEYIRCSSQLVTNRLRTLIAFKRLWQHWESPISIIFRRQKLTNGAESYKVFIA